MTGSGARQGLGDLTRSVMRVLLVYALTLQMLAPLAVARAEARDGLGSQPILCSSMANAGVERHGKVPSRIVHDCLSCCLGSVVGILATPTEWPKPASLPLLIASPLLKRISLPVRAGSPPPQRAPPGLA